MNNKQDDNTSAGDSLTLIDAREFCIHHNIDVSFIDTIQDNGLIETTVIEETIFVHPSQLQLLEKIARLHFDLSINMEGVETIINMLQRIESLQNEIKILWNRLRFYESVD
ncbi:MAG TPA: chaperone modulator CbpM [Bacteroidales bacterium]|nr:chaperone modulator CbpM [Bacteroidales bacterium]